MKLNLKKKNQEKDDSQYLDYIKSHAPKTKEFKTLIPSFIVGGLICMLGQGIYDLLDKFTNLNEEMLGNATSIILIFLGSFFTGVGLYDRLGRIAGGGSIVPITGFANSIVSPAMEYKHEGVIFGICSQMFTIAGPIIVLGISLSCLVGIITLLTL